MIKKKDLLKRIACITSAVVVTLSATLYVGNLAERVTANAYSNLTGEGQPLFGVGQDYIIQMSSGFELLPVTVDEPGDFSDAIDNGGVLCNMSIQGGGQTFVTSVFLTSNWEHYVNPIFTSTLYVTFNTTTNHLRIQRPYLFYWNGLYPFFTDSDCTIYLSSAAYSLFYFEFAYLSDSTDPYKANPFSIHTDLAGTYYNNYYDVIYNEGYDQGEALGLQEGYQEGYDEGYQEGYDEGDTEGYNSGYNLGYENGERVGYNNGLTAGYEQATAEGDFSWNSFFSAFIDVPINAFTSLLNFEILGVNLAGFFGGLLTVCLIIVIMKFIL